MSHKYLRDEDFENKNKTENFNLSHKELIKLGEWRGLYYKKEDVKEFIRRLKDEFIESTINDGVIYTKSAIIKHIDKLAGNNLI